eukprot:Gregarina_sp_Poly_1__6510@NODE_348_length_9346_cov_198_894493_g291_i0_p5_GENE_NODE_348_length_9346_cov_198_894493_g291_i0NODE_348_length_9346_cov_198_894493_g291_i0_p5_ORF_typecomplete_len229_score24_53ADK/PF00406_22/1_3e57AAA_17/PF13207_6/2e23ADK_lid/PF05191_14/3_8e16AAA_33/PF13671_6/1_2e09AAA_18/PF13238_6/2_6e06Zeta_toxin/PF06414_12/0_00019Zeta_toxin/PF06414_12/1_4e03CoaE/PF01121_20/0_031CoaE/PF01121_20/4e03Cytidylate_kin/PF02224_18/0_017Hydin_ADK/PF17213_3/5_9Hydin_ADK/PF17213_3/7_3DUF952/PF0
MNGVILLGAPGCGKGTQSVWLKEEAGFVHLSTGDLLREAVAEGTEVGKRAKDIMSRGELVPDEIVLAIVNERLNALVQNPDFQGFILDGFPRTVAQAEGLDKIMQSQGARLTAVIYFDCPDELLKVRVCGRRVHPASGRTYHVVYRPPKVKDVDDVTGDPLVHRVDDNEDTFVARLATYRQTTMPLIDYYTKKQVLYTVHADKSAAEVRKEMERILMKEPTNVADACA